MTPTVAELFDIAIYLEEAGEGVYKHWQTLFADYPKVGAFWKEYQEEEFHHAKMLRKIKSGLTPEQLTKPADPEVYRTALNTREDTKNIKMNVATLDEALDLATQIENSEINTILEFLVTHFSEEESTKEMVHEQMRKHVEKLNKLSPALIFGKDYKTIKAVR
jgi:Rubrerythrin